MSAFKIKTKEPLISAGKNELFFKEQLTVMSMNICACINTMVSIKNRTPFFNNSGVFISYTHVVKPKPTLTKDELSSYFLSILNKIDFKYKGMKEAFLSEFLKTVIKENIDYLYIFLGGQNSVVGEAIHQVLFEVANSPSCNPELREYVDYIHVQYMKNTADYISSLLQLPTNITSIDKNTHNRYLKSYSVLVKVFDSISSNEIKYNECFTILHDYIFIKYKGNTRIQSWFVPYFMTVENLKILLSPLYILDGRKRSSLVDNSIKAIAFTSTIYDRYISDFNKDKNTLFAINGVCYMRNRTFDKCLEAIKTVYLESKDSVLKEDLLRTVEDKIYPILDKIISDRLAKNQLINN